MKKSPLDDWIYKKISTLPGGFTQNALNEYQLQKLNMTLRHVRDNSRFYQKHLNPMPETIRTLQDFHQFPFLSSTDLMAYSSEMVCVPQGQISRIVTMNTSGTTGTPKRVYFTPEDQELTIDFFGVGMSTLVDKSDRVMILLPDAIPGSVGDLLFTGLQRIGTKPVKHGPVIDLDETLTAVIREKITSLVGAPTQVLALCSYFKRVRTDPSVSIKSILLSTDHVPDSLKNNLENTFNCRVYNHYGMTEMGLGGGVFCHGNVGYHLREADMLFEIIDPLNGTIQPDGVLGELVFTTLTRIGMPLIRYRTGDYSRFLPIPCPCSSKLRVLEKITNRIDQLVGITNGSFYLSEIDEILFSNDELINFKVEIFHQKGKDLIAVFLYSLFPLKNISVYKDKLRAFFEAKHVRHSSYQIQINSIVGYPSELSTLRKRKVIEHFQ